MGEVWLFQAYSLSCWAGLIWGKPDLNELNCFFAYEVMAHWLLVQLLWYADRGHTPAGYQSQRLGVARARQSGCWAVQHGPDFTPSAPSGTWTPELEGCQQSLDTGEYFWHFPGGNAMCPTCNVGLQPFLFGSWSRASDKREQKKTENSSQPLKNVSEVCLKGKAQTLHQDASPVWQFPFAFPLALNPSCGQDYLPTVRIHMITVGVKEIWSCYSSSLTWF